MQIVTDSGVDTNMSSRELEEYGIHVVPLRVTLEDRTYREGLDISKEEFYQLLASSKELPRTTQPSPGEFAELYRKLAEKDPDILSIHMSSGLSGTYQSAVLASQMVPEARITHVDTKTLSAPAGWQVEAAARVIRAGWALDKVLELVKSVSHATETLFTLEELKYLIHGGRISHMKGLVAAVLNIKPVIGVEKEKGTYVQMAFLRTFKKAIKGVVDIIEKKHAPGSQLRVQVVHAQNPEGAALLQEQIADRFSCTFLPKVAMSLVLGAHTGPSMIGVAYADASIFSSIPA
ncbi:MAG: DegV family protein [Dehalococcoidales bacterium]|jgi:DegV family protein with EDD domain|nr:DegV family protein [Dehalococcoidales bacterium]MDD4465322.1 DegV family protein [Dehalococcoidales bacterium]MDD5402319.1 DegV family protein [Dehalococcoidales bacterium]